MKKFTDSLKLLLIVLGSIFIVNMAAMYLIFGINVLSPVHKGASINAGNSGYEPYSGPSPAEPGATERPSQSEPAPDPAADPSANIKGFAGAEGDGSAWFMTKDEVECLGSLSITDKLSALSLIAKIGQKDADRIYDMATDGVTLQEMREIESILGKSLSQDEMDIVNNIIEKNRELYAGRIE